jgi:type I restriction enzyme, S subunit
MKQDWEIKKLGEVCEVIAGQSPQGKFYNSNENGLPFYQGKKEFTEKFIGAPTTWTTKITKEAEANDILMSVRAPVGPINFATQKICIGRGLAAIRASKLIDKEFLFNFLLKHENEIVGNSGAVFNSINKTQIGAIPISLPPLLEQKRIIAILDKAFAAIANAKSNSEQNLKNAKELFESYLQGVFEKKGKDWEEKPLSELCSIKHGFAFKSQYFSNKGKYVLLTPGNFYEEGGYRNREEKQKYYIGEIPEGYILKKGDLLVAMTEQAAGLLGSPILVPDSNTFLHNQRLGLVLPKEDAPWMNEFFFHVFNTRKVREILHSTGTGIKVRHTSPTKIGDVIVRFPSSIKVQQTIVQKLDILISKTKKLEAIYQQKIEDFEELKKSLLQKAFNGELAEKEITL